MSSPPSYECVDLSRSQHHLREQFAQDLRAGLGAEAKHLSLKYTYDEIGSPLFEEISHSDPYYVTRTEDAILGQYAGEIAGLMPADTALVELGSGSSRKTLHLIEALLAKQGESLFVPIDISRDFLFAAAGQLCDRYADLRVLALAADYDAALELLAERVRQPRLIIWLGSDIGQLTYADAANLLKRNLLPWMNPEDRLLVGIDLKKSADALHAAYGCLDRKPLNKSFSSNPLARANREFNGDIQLDYFERRCHYDEAKGCVKVYLECTKDHQASIKDLDFTVNFSVGEIIHIHCAQKYAQADLEQLARAAGFDLKRQWFDADRIFSVNLFAPCSGQSYKG